MLHRVNKEEPKEATIKIENEGTPREPPNNLYNFPQGKLELQQVAKEEEMLQTALLKTTSSSTNLNQFSSTLFEDLQSLLSSSISEPLASNEALPDSQITRTSSDFANFDFQIIDFIDKSQIFDANHKLLLNNPDPHGVAEDTLAAPPDPASLFAMSHQEENMMLKHFFKKLLPLLDGHPKSPWPDLALQYCDFDIARSCFISLACIHLYESRAGGSELYQKGLAHINNTMDHLIHYIRENSNRMNKEQDNDALADQNKKHISYFVILVLMNVHLLFAVLEKGKSSIAREFFKIFASICKDPVFYNQILKTSDKRRSLAVVLSWYDTVSAIVTPDCRNPYCLPQWYGKTKDDISTSKMMGCPGEIFVAMAEVCQLRNKKFNGLLAFEDMNVAYTRIRYALVSYRDYVSTFDKDSNETYTNRLKCALCWSLAVWITLNKVIEPENYIATNQKLTSEFIHTYDQMDPKSSLVTQMVWPIYAIGCECKTDWERSYLTRFMDNLYENTKMGTTASLKEIVLNVWDKNITQEEYLMEWLGKGVDYLPL